MLPSLKLRARNLNVFPHGLALDSLTKGPMEIPTEIPTNPLTTISIILAQPLDVVRISHGTQIIANTQRKASLPHLAIRQRKGD